MTARSASTTTFVMTERTATHTYPAEETLEMRSFYGGKTCIITLRDGSSGVHWSHMLAASLEASNPRVSTVILLHMSNTNYTTLACVDVRQKTTPRPTSSARRRGARKSCSL